MEPIEVNTHFKNPEYPTRVRIIDLDGHFEHAGDYTGPKYTFSVEVEVKYNKVVDGKEKNLITCTFWTKTDSSVFSFEDDDLDEDSVEDWFLDGLSEDLSFHGFEGLEKLDFYTLGVPTNESDEAELTIEDYISKAFDKCFPDIWENYEYQCSELYLETQEDVPFSTKIPEELKEKALKAYQGFLWRTKSYLTDTVRSYKQAAKEGLIKDLIEMFKISKEIALLAGSEEEGQQWLLKRDANLGQQMKYCEEWMDKLGIEHKTFEEYVKRPFD